MNTTVLTAAACTVVAVTITQKLNNRKLAKIKSAHKDELFAETTRYHSFGFDGGVEFARKQEDLYTEFPALRPKSF